MLLSSWHNRIILINALELRKIQGRLLKRIFFIPMISLPLCTLIMTFLRRKRWKKVQFKLKIRKLLQCFCIIFANLKRSCFKNWVIIWMFSRINRTTRLWRDWTIWSIWSQVENKSRLKNKDYTIKRPVGREEKGKQRSILFIVIWA